MSSYTTLTEEEITVLRTINLDVDTEDEGDEELSQSIDGKLHDKEVKLSTFTLEELEFIITILDYEGNCNKEDEETACEISSKVHEAMHYKKEERDALAEMSPEK